MYCDTWHITYEFLDFTPTQIKRYDDRKRQFPVVYTDEYVRIHEYYDRIRAVEHPFGRDRITPVNRRSYTA
jgi:hypothetical protein